LKKARIDRELLVSLYEHQRLSCAQIGKIFGITGETIRYWLKKYGIQRRNNGVLLREWWNNSDNLEQIRQARFKQGQTFKKLWQIEEYRQKFLNHKVLRGSEAPWFGKSRPDYVKEKIRQKLKGHKHTEESKKKMSEARKGENNPAKRKDVRFKISQKKKGFRHKPETCLLISQKRKNKYTGENNPNWKGGRSQLIKNIYKTSEYIEWQKKCMERDNFRCIICGENRKTYLTVHHLYSKDIYFDKIFDVDNGVTICKKCHRKFHNHYGYGKNTLEQWNEFLLMQMNRKKEDDIVDKIASAV
jgi:5-methylcytosine-specific restriction endonuclease McrA